VPECEFGVNRALFNQDVRARVRELTRAPTPEQGIEGVRSFFERSEYALLLTDEYLLALPDDDDGPTPTT
jgi:hypothetical protein